MSCLINTEVKNPGRIKYDEKNLASKGEYNMALSIDKGETRIGELHDKSNGRAG